MPEASALAKLRRDVDKKPHKIKEVLTRPEIRRSFLGDIPKKSNYESNRSERSCGVCCDAQKR